MNSNRPGLSLIESNVASVEMQFWNYSNSNSNLNGFNLKFSFDRPVPWKAEIELEPNLIWLESICDRSGTRVVLQFYLIEMHLIVSLFYSAAPRLDCTRSIGLNWIELNWIESNRIELNRNPLWKLDWSGLELNVIQLESTVIENNWFSIWSHFGLVWFGIGYQWNLASQLASTTGNWIGLDCAGIGIGLDRTR